MKESNLKAVLENKLRSGRNTKILRFLLECLSGTPVVGGAFGAAAAAWSEADLTKINIFLYEAQQILDERIDENEKKLVAVSERQQWVAAYIKFNPNNAAFVDSSNVSSITDHGHLDFSINFMLPLQERFTLQYFGNGEVRLEGVVESRSLVRVRFLEPCPDMVTFVFFNLQMVQDM